jgi:uncharacterized protein YxeA
MKRVFVLLIFVFVMIVYGETVWLDVDCSTDSTTYQLMKNIKLVDADRISVILKNNGDQTAYYQLRGYADAGYDEYDYQGFAGATGDSLYAAAGGFATGATLIGQKVENVTDGSEGTITKATATVITAVLSGGTNNSWTSGDHYKVTEPGDYYTISSDSLLTTEQATYELDSYYTRLVLYLKKYATADSLVECRFNYGLTIRK